MPNFYEIPIETPIQPKMDVSPFPRVLVAGFIAGGTDDVDANLETVRLLRSQLRIEVDPPRDRSRRPAADDMAGAEQGRAPARGSNGSSGGPTAPPRRRSSRRPAQPVADAGIERSAQAARAKIRNEKDLSQYQGIFANTAFWKKLGEEYQNPLIVTGTVLFTPHEEVRVRDARKEVYDQFGRRRVVPVRTSWSARDSSCARSSSSSTAGRAPLYSETFNEEVLYTRSRTRRRCRPTSS